MSAVESETSIFCISEVVEAITYLKTFYTHGVMAILANSTHVEGEPQELVLAYCA